MAKHETSEDMKEAEVTKDSGKAPAMPQEESQNVEASKNFLNPEGNNMKENKALSDRVTNKTTEAGIHEGSKSEPFEIEKTATHPKRHSISTPKSNPPLKETAETTFRDVENAKDIKEKDAAPVPVVTSHQTSLSQESNYQQVARGLDQAYGVVHNDHTCDEQARRIFARRAAFWSMLVTCSYLCLGALFFASQTDWDSVDVALFTVYTVTSAGYGHVDIPTTALFRIVDTFYILIGLSLMAIMMAQVFQYLELEAKRFHAGAMTDKVEVIEQGIERLVKEPQSVSRDLALAELRHQRRSAMGIFGKPAMYVSRLYVFSIENPWGDFLYRITSLVCLILSGAVVVGCLEGWNWYTSMYWSVISLTTVGYGDVVPETDAGKIVTTIWLPLNLFFLSILFCSVGHYYLHFADTQISKIKNKLQERPTKKEGSQAGTVSGDDGPSLGSSTSSSNNLPDLEAGVTRKVSSLTSESPEPEGGMTKETLHNVPNRRYFGAKLDTMQDVLNVMKDKDGNFVPEESDVGSLSHPMAVSVEKPNFFLRVKVKERLAHIVVMDVVGRRSSVTTNDKLGHLSVYLGGTVAAAQRWIIPRRAQYAFCAVAFEALLFVGEDTLLRDGAAALFRLSPGEFHRIFSPLLVAMGDSEALQSWLTATEVLSGDLDQTRPNRNRRGRRPQLSLNSMHYSHHDYAQSDKKLVFPTNHAEGFHLFHDS